MHATRWCVTFACHPSAHLRYYDKHYDNSGGGDMRKLTVIIYLQVFRQALMATTICTPYAFHTMREIA